MNNDFYLKALSNFGVTMHPFYHTVSDKVRPHCKYNFNIKRIDEFEAEIDLLASNFSIIDYHELLAKQDEGRNIKRDNIILSFDDGYSECYDIIKPLLKEKGIPAIFFINPYFIGSDELSVRNKISLIKYYLLDHGMQNKRFVLLEIAKVLSVNPNIESIMSSFDLMRNARDSSLLNLILSILEIDEKEYVKIENPYLNFEQTQRLTLDGFHIGNHTYRHNFLQKLSDADRQNDIILADKFIEKLNLGYETPISIPFYDSDLLNSDLNKLRNFRIERNIFGSGNNYSRKLDNYFLRFTTEWYSGNSGLRKLYYDVMKHFLKLKIKSLRKLR